MDKKNIVVLIINHRNGTEVDVEVPLDITANEFIVAVNESFDLKMDTDNLFRCYLRAENPIALIKGDKLIRDFGLYDGSIIHLI